MTDSTMVQRKLTASPGGRAVCGKNQKDCDQAAAKHIHKLEAQYRVKTRRRRCLRRAGRGRLQNSATVDVRIREVPRILKGPARFHNAHHVVPL